MDLSYIAAVYVPEYTSGFIAQKADSFLKSRPAASCIDLVSFLANQSGLDRAEQGLADYTQAALKGNYTLSIIEEYGTSREISPLERAVGVFEQRYLREPAGITSYMGADFEIKAISGIGSRTFPEGSGARTSSPYEAALPSQFHNKDAATARIALSRFLQKVRQLSESPRAITAIYLTANRITDGANDGLTMNLGELAQEVCEGQKGFYITAKTKAGPGQLLYSRAMLNVGYAVGSVTSQSGGTDAEGLDRAISICVAYLYRNASDGDWKLFDHSLTQLSARYSDDEIVTAAGLAARGASRAYPKTAFAIGYQLAIDDAGMPPMAGVVAGKLPPLSGVSSGNRPVFARAMASAAR